jgi:hypothetical protein
MVKRTCTIYPFALITYFKYLFKCQKQIFKKYNYAFIVKQFKYLGTSLRNQNSIHEEIKSRLKSRNACYPLVQSPLYPRLLSKNIKIKIYRIIIFLFVLYGCEAWSLTLREEHRLRVFENRVVRKIFGPKRDEVTGEWRRLYNEELHVCNLHEILFG